MILDDAAFETIPDFAASQFRIKAATEPWERAGAHALRRKVFCAEQRLFDDDDRDALDERALLLVAVTTIAGMPDDVVGTVRIDEREPGLWYGSRLAVDRRYRRVAALGAGLIRLAVTTAHGHGCLRFLAHVQSRNELLFRQLHWTRLGETALHGAPHVLMQADLAYYPASPLVAAGFTALARRAA
jgi:putative N-acetyltransferase (TIGR04045 family)